MTSVLGSDTEHLDLDAKDNSSCDSSNNVSVSGQIGCIGKTSLQQLGLQRLTQVLMGPGKY